MATKIGIALEIHEPGQEPRRYEASFELTEEKSRNEQIFARMLKDMGDRGRAAVRKVGA